MVVIFFNKHPLFMIWMPGQCISFIEHARLVEDSEDKLGKEEGPTGLTVEKFLFGVEVDKVVMIRPDLKGGRVAFKVMTEGFQSSKDGK
jgi:hypothetical protein